MQLLVDVEAAFAEFQDLHHLAILLKAGDIEYFLKLDCLVQALAQHALAFFGLPFD